MKSLLVELGFAARPDDSGIRAKGVLRQPVKRAKNYPYDLPTFYGTPQAYDRGSGTHGELHNPIVPKDTSHSIWDETDEMVGVPMNFTQAYKGSSSQRGGYVSGVGSWANNPAKPWDEDEELEKLESYIDNVSSYTENPAHPNPEEIPNAKKQKDLFSDPEDSSFFSDQEDSREVLSVGSPMPFSQGLGRAFGYRMGLMPKESVWKKLADSLNI